MFLSRVYRPNKWPFYVLAGLESGLTVGLLALTGIAAPNLYRKKLWQDGADNGFNSSPLAGLYAAANYRPYKTPMVWSQFITNYNLVIAVLSMFLLLVKFTMYMLHVFPPICSVILHAVLMALYAVAVAFQGSSDTTDPKHPQNGPAWYIVKSCSVAHNPNNINYCTQAKATFACFTTMTGIFFLYFATALWSCFPSKAQQIAYNERQRAKKERWAHLDEMESKTPKTSVFSLTSGLNPMTPRTFAFNKLGGTQEEKQTRFDEPEERQAPTFALRSPGLPRSPMAVGFADQQSNAGPSQTAAPQSLNAAMYFPPPPKKSILK